ncbi:2-oxo acid dehydrogenase subunit E2 [Streptomyces roseicoloratus]|uniref:Dihydrolipoamide acetyltransferase component of pyruvate dehydrogenase complex n=1 Tax=Streptomyces roseicoloratus TaxID=2508722 RepID=A0ABY9S1X2_9ACTN|nr:2-oxo acid dehydrogenase subunit E2 [Streptomyces roseicoloratus]WMX48430.1 2-oxo acid dehydrogenase subunit E2 [Streptomyces roseicoloratus]
MAEFTMPSLGADMDEGTLSQWLVHPGDRVTRGDVVAVVETAKSAIEVECFDSGTVNELLVDEGTTVPVGTPLAVIATSDDQRPVATPLVRRLADERHVDLAAVHGSGPGGRITRADVEGVEAERSHAPDAKHSVAPSPDKDTDTTPKQQKTAAKRRRQQTPEPVRGATAEPRPSRGGAPRLRDDLVLPQSAGPDQGNVSPEQRPGSAPIAGGPARVHASPLARRLAAELSVDLAEVSGTGRGGSVRAGDVRATAAKAARPHGHHDAARVATARLMSRSKREIPHFYLSTTVDMAAALDWMHARNRDLPLSARLVPAALMLKAVALAARKVPELNGHWIDDAFVPADEVRLGVAVSLRSGGLVAPALAHADTLSVVEVMAALRGLVARARHGRLRSSETTDPSITVTNLGDQGVEAVYGVVYPPQVALVGLGRIVERPVAVDGLLGVRPVVTATLSADHRAADGATGARLLTALDRLLQQPEEL